MSAEAPSWIRSARFRIALTYSIALFVIGAILLGTLYLALLASLRKETVYQRFPATGTESFGDAGIIVSDIREFERRVNEHALTSLKDFSFAGLGALFVISLGLGWVIAGRVLAPVDRITDVANHIQATDLSQRIRLAGPDDEFKRLADTFDGMLSRLEEAFARQRRFVADASHELRNPLAVIRTNNDLILADQSLTGDGHRHAAVVARAVTRMARLVDDLLALASLDAPAARRDVVDLASLAQEVAEEMSALAEKKRLRIDVDTVAPPQVRGDREALKRAVTNLADNAIRYAPADTSVLLGVGERDGWAWVAVSDRGPGIAPEHREMVFDRLWRTDDARSREDGGSGLGLAIVKQIVESHAGEVRLWSEPAEGSTFAILLPTERAGDRPPDEVPGGINRLFTPFTLGSKNEL
jgi:signal transduction histidine kinase